MHLTFYFIYFWLRRIFALCEQGLLLIIVVHGRLIAVASLTVEHGLSGASASVLVAYRLSCSEAYGIFPDQGSDSCSLHWQVDS